MVDFDDRLLDELRGRTDAAADDTVALLRDGREELSTRDFMAQLTSLAKARRNLRCAEVQGWFDVMPDLPAWATNEESLARVRRGQAFFHEWSLPITASLFCGSLPAAYAAAKGARVLGLMSDLARPENVNRRVAETGKMLIDVMELGAPDSDSIRPLTFGTTGQQSIRGVRLLHGVIRHALERDPIWCAERDVRGLGRPINQEDLLGTLLTFTTVVFRGLDQMGLHYDREEAEAYLHTWCVIGAQLGIDADLLPLELDQADDLMWLIARRQQTPSADGTKLTAALLEEMQSSMPWGLRKVPRTLIRKLLPTDVCDKIEVPAAAWWHPILDEATRWNRTLTRLPFVDSIARTASEVIGKAMIRLYVDRNLDGKAPFEVQGVALEQTEPAEQATRTARVELVAAHYGVETTPARRAMRKGRRKVRRQVGKATAKVGALAGATATQINVAPSRPAGVGGA